MSPLRRAQTAGVARGGDVNCQASSCGRGRKAGQVSSPQSTDRWRDFEHTFFFGQIEKNLRHVESGIDMGWRDAVIGQREKPVLATRRADRLRDARAHIFCAGLKPGKINKGEGRLHLGLSRRRRVRGEMSKARGQLLINRFFESNYVLDAGL